MLGRWGRLVVAMASLSVLMACGGGSDAVVDPVVPEATTSTPMPPFDAAALPPHPLADHADFDAIVRELFAIRDDAFRHLDVERLEAVYAVECPCREQAHRDIEDAIRDGYRIVGDEVGINSIDVETILKNRGAFVLLKVHFPEVSWIDRSAPFETVVADAEPDSTIRVALGHDAARWVIVNIERIS